MANKAIKLHSAQIIGLGGHIIDVEVDAYKGQRKLSVVGLPDKAVEESAERISSAIKNTGLTSPQKQQQRVTISLAPADLKKEGPVFDLPIALGYLLASDQIKFNTKDKIFFGELSLDGKLRPIKGTLSLASSAKKYGFKEIYLPKENSNEAALIEGVNIYGAESLEDIIQHLSGEVEIPASPKTKIIQSSKNTVQHSFDLSDIRGQESAKRGLEIAAAGGHNLLMVGPPGTGKTMLARALPSILPSLDINEALEATAIHSISGTINDAYISERPFRSPHHTSSYVAVSGGGVYPKPGEITLAHRGVLFLDEFPEFDRRVIESLREPLENGTITISRAKGTLNFPAQIMLICAMNPCPCGNLGSKTKQCLCSQGAILKYKRKVSGPIADRLDLWLEVPQIDHEELGSGKQSGPSSEEVRKRVMRARKIQKERLASNRILTNSEISAKNIDKFAPLSSKLRLILNRAAKNMDLSPRAYHRVIKIARTIADLDNSENIEEKHLLESLQYRPKQMEI